MIKDEFCFDYGRKYPLAWRTLNTGKMFDNKRVGNFGLTETVNDNLWNMVGVPAPWLHTFHLRVVQGPEEAPQGIDGQYYGDFWGMHLNFEDYDAVFMDTHELEDGNLYKLKDGIFNGNELKRNQGRYAVTDDSDFQKRGYPLYSSGPVAYDAGMEPKGPVGGIDYPQTFQDFTSGLLPSAHA